MDAGLRGVFVFFFSSRRRHTRCSRDWSSDMCSSDLTDAGGFLALPEARVHVTSDLPDSLRGIATLTFGGNHAFPQHTDNTTAEVRERSEERRVGKECRSRWSPYH